MLTAVQQFRQWLIAGFIVLSIAPAVRAVESWEFDPYSVRVWLVAGESPAVTPALLDHVAAGIRNQAELTVSAAWQMEVQPAPPALAADLFLPDLPPDYARLKTGDAQIGGYDKLFALRVDCDTRGFVVAAREYDPRLRTWSLISERSIAQREQLPYTAWDALRSTFLPIVRIEKVDQKTIVSRLRAGGLIVDAANPAALNPGNTMQPAVRRNDRSGEPMKGAGIQFAAWTVVLVKERTGALVTGELHSGIRFPIPTRGAVRMERLAVKIAPHFASTRLSFASKAADEKPLEGYDVYTKAPDTTDAKLLGKTDWQGEFEILPNENPVQILYVRSGDKLLARLPLVPGSSDRIEVRLADDQIRLQAEGIVAALQSRITDLVARREIFAARIRIGIKNKKYEDALQLVQEFRKLETYISLKNAIDQYRAAVQAPDKATNARISKSFQDITQLASRFLDAEMADKLEASIIADRDARPPTPAPTPAPAAPTQPVPMPAVPPEGAPNPTTSPASPSASPTETPPPSSDNPASAAPPPASTDPGAVSPPPAG